MVSKNKPTALSRERFVYTHRSHYGAPQPIASDAVVVAIARPVPVSSKQLDFWLLALCSCVLTLLCHSITTVPQSATNSSSVLPSAQSSNSSHSVVAFKLFTLTTPRPELEEDEPA